MTTAEDNINVLATTFAAYLVFQVDMRIPIPNTYEDLEALAVRLDEAKIGYPEFPTSH